MNRAPSKTPSLPGRLLRAGGLSIATVVATVVVAFTVASYEVFYLHHVDPKWGDEWANVSIVVWVTALTALLQAALLFALLLSPVFSPLLLSARARLASLVSFVVLTVVLFPPKARYPLLTAILAVVLSVALGRLVSALLASARPRPHAAASSSR